MSQRIFVSGANSRLSENIRVRLQTLGAQVCVSTEHAPAEQNAFHAEPDSVQQFRLMQAEFESAEATMGGIDALVNLCVVRQVPRSPRLSAEQWHASLAALTGTEAQRCVAGLPFLQRQVGIKRIINVWLPAIEPDHHKHTDRQQDAVDLIVEHTKHLAEAYTTDGIVVMSLILHQQTQDDYQQIPVWVQFFIGEPTTAANGSTIQLGLVPSGENNVGMTA